MHYRDLIDVPQIPWTPLDQRMGHGPVRQIPIEQAAPTPSSAPSPEPYQPSIASFPRHNRGEYKKRLEFPACTDAQGHRMVSNGQPDGRYRLKCSRCHKSRLATEQEVGELRANGGRSGRRKGMILRGRAGHAALLVACNDTETAKAAPPHKFETKDMRRKSWKT